MGGNTFDHVVKVAKNLDRLSESKFWSFDGIVKEIDSVALDMPSGRFHYLAGFAGWGRSPL